ncbi:MAG: HDIG domain-containing metalloprotein [Bacillota bacterium]
MPPFKTHLAASQKRTGKDFVDLHHWLDNDPDKQVKADRHSLVKLSQNKEYVRVNWGEEAVPEFFQHLVEDLVMQDIETLRKAGCPEEAVAHSVEVARKALEISSRVSIDLDRQLIVCGAIYHDLGKAKTYGLEHGEIGAAMARELNLGDEIVNIILKHIRGGLTEQEALELDLPVRDYTLKTPEEKIIIYTDRMVDIYTEDIVDLDETGAEERFVEILTQYPKYGKNTITTARYVKLHHEIHDWMKG